MPTALNPYAEAFVPAHITQQFAALAACQPDKAPPASATSGPLVDEKHVSLLSTGYGLGTRHEYPGHADCVQTAAGSGASVPMQARGAPRHPIGNLFANLGRRRIPMDEQWAGLSACLRMPPKAVALCRPKGAGPPQGEDWAGLPPELVAQIFAHLPLRDRKLGEPHPAHTPALPPVKAGRQPSSMPVDGVMLITSTCAKGCGSCICSLMRHGKPC